MTMLPIPLESICYECRKPMMRVSCTHRMHKECTIPRRKRLQLERYKRLHPTNTINPKRINPKTRARYIKNRVALIAYQTEYNRIHKDQVAANQKIWYRKNRDRLLAEDKERIRVSKLIGGNYQ